MDRETFIKNQAQILDDFFSFTTGEEQARKRFENLALNTRDFLAKTTKTIITPFYISPESAGNFLASYGNPYYDWNKHYSVPIPGELIQRWQQWNNEFYELRERNPRLELRDMIQDCSETHDFSSWPTSPWEADILHWVLNGDLKAYPFDDRKNIINEAFYLRFQEIHRRCGGWLFRENGKIIFLADEEAKRKPVLFPPNFYLRKKPQHL